MIEILEKEDGRKIKSGRKKTKSPLGKAVDTKDDKIKEESKLSKQGSKLMSNPNFLKVLAVRNKSKEPPPKPPKGTLDILGMKGGKGGSAS